MQKFIVDVALLFRHFLRMTLREPVWIVVGLFQPVCWLLLFGPLLESISFGMPGAEGDVITLFTSGMLVMMGMFSTIFVGFGLLSELRAGVIERLRVTPVSRLAPLLARAFRDGLILLVQSCLLILVAIPMGLGGNIIGIMLSLLMVLVMGIALACVSYSVALMVKNEDAFASMLNFVSQPILLLSGIVLPLSLAPFWLKTLAGFNPLYYIVDGSRALFIGDFQNPAILFGFLAVGILTGVGMLWAMQSFKKATA